MVLLLVDVLFYFLFHNIESIQIHRQIIDLLNDIFCLGGSTTGDDEECVEGAGGAAAVGGVCVETKRNTQHNESIQGYISYSAFSFVNIFLNVPFQV